MERENNPPIILSGPGHKGNIIWVAGDHEEVDYWPTIRQLDVQHKGGLFYYSIGATNATLSLGKMVYTYLHISVRAELSWVREELARHILANGPSLNIIKDGVVIKVADTMEECLAIIPLTPTRIAKWLATIHIEVPQIVTYKLKCFVEPPLFSKSCVRHLEVTPGEKVYARQIDINAAYPQLRKRLGTWSPICQIDMDAVQSVEYKGTKISWGRMQVIKFKSCEKGDHDLDESFKIFWDGSKKNRLITFGALASGLEKNSAIRVLYWGKDDGELHDRLARFPLEKWTYGGIAAIMARAALRQLSELIWAVSSNIKAVLTDSYISSSNLPEQILDLLGIDYKVQAEGDLEIYSPSCYKVGEKETKNFDKFRSSLNGEELDQIDVFPEYVDLDILQVVLGLDDTSMEAAIQKIIELAKNERKMGPSIRATFRRQVKYHISSPKEFNEVWIDGQ